jgi:uncharacterized repeat protein (TIGR01451 family)
MRRGFGRPVRRAAAVRLPRVRLVLLRFGLALVTLALMRTNAASAAPTSSPLHVRIQSSPTAVRPGDEVTYVITYTNVGSDTLHDIVVEGGVPAGTHYVPGSAAGPGAVATVDRRAGADSGARDARAVDRPRWRLEPLAPGASGSVAYRVHIE